MPAIALALLGGLVACGGPAVAPTSPPAPAVTATVAGPGGTPTSLAGPTSANATSGAVAPGAAATLAVPVASPSARAASATAEPTALPSEVENAYLTNVDDLIAEAADLAVTPCEDLTAITQANPNVLPSVRGFAAALKRVGTTQAALDTDAVRASLADLDHSMGELEGALSLCGIWQP